MNKREKKKYAHPRLHQCNIVLFVVLILLMVPVVYACQYLYSQGDDNMYAVLPHLAFVYTHSLPSILLAACKQVEIMYFAWQGTFTSIFLMSLEPGLFNQEFYHIAPLLILIPFCLANWLFFDTLLHRILGIDRTLSNGLSLLTILILTQNPRQVAEAFTWYNGAVHYSGIHTLWLVTFTLLLCRTFLEQRTRAGTAVLTVFLCTLQFLLGGGNNLSVLEALVVEAVLMFFLVLFDREHRTLRLRRLLLPYFFLVAGAMVNFLAHGNIIRMGTGGAAQGVPLTILYCYRAGILMTREFLDIPTVLYFLWGMFYLHPIVKELEEKSSFSFRLPGLVLFALYSIFSAIWAPNIYTGGPGGTSLKRTQNVAYDHFILLVLCGLVYFGVWCRKNHMGEKLLTANRKRRKGLLQALLAGLSFFTVGGIWFVLYNAPMHFLTSSAIHCIADGGGQAWADTIRQNLEIIEDAPDDTVIIVDEPITHEEFIRTPPEDNEMSTWRYGLRDYYEKKSILYDYEAKEEENQNDVKSEQQSD